MGDSSLESQVELTDTGHSSSFGRDHVGGIHETCEWARGM